MSSAYVGTVSALPLSHPSRHTPGGVDPNPHRYGSSLRRGCRPEAPGGASGFFSSGESGARVTMRRGTSHVADAALKHRPEAGHRRAVRDSSVVLAWSRWVPRAGNARSSMARAGSTTDLLARRTCPVLDPAKTGSVSATDAGRGENAGNHRSRACCPTTGRSRRKTRSVVVIATAAIAGDVVPVLVGGTPGQADQHHRQGHDLHSFHRRHPRYRQSRRDAVNCRLIRRLAGRVNAKVRPLSQG